MREMSMKFTCKTVVESDSYMQIKYNGEILDLRRFAEKYADKSNEFYLDTLLKECIIIYKGTEMTFTEMCLRITKFADSLPISLHYQHLYSNEHIVFTVDRDYYAALKMLESVEKNLMLGRKYLLNAYSLIDYNVNLHWDAGYAGVFNFRCIAATTAIMWLSTVFDTMLQMVLWGYGIYKVHPDYIPGMDFHKTLKLCDYDFMSDYYGKNKAVPNFKKLWGILTKAYNATSDIRYWTNFIKHKGGIGFIGETAPKPYIISVSTSDGKESDKDYEKIMLDLDHTVSDLSDFYNRLHQSIDELVGFFQFEKITLTQDGDKLLFPDQEAYKKLII
jgi:hypothetical protein